jgi:hypothetical protein
MMRAIHPHLVGIGLRESDGYGFDIVSSSKRKEGNETQGDSVRKIVNVLSAGLQVAVDDGRIPANPASRLNMSRQSKRRKKFLTHQQVAELAAAGDPKPAGRATAPSCSCSRTPGCGGEGWPG